MDPIIEEFVHQQNLRRFQTLLDETKDVPRRHHLSKLLAEGEAKVRRQRGQVGKVMATASAHATGWRARHGIEPHGAERLAADAAKS
jgi:hypothetical protein